MVSFHVFGLQKCHFRRRKEKKKKNVGKSIGDPVRGRDAPITSYLHGAEAKDHCKTPVNHKIKSQLGY